MIDMLSSIITNVLTALYQPFGFSILMSVLFMFFYMYAYCANEAGHGIKAAIVTWCRYFKKDSFFRRLFLLAFFVTLILFRTLLNRNLWLNPLSDVMGGWGLWIIDKNTGEKILTTESIENVAMMLPFTVLLFWTAKDKILGSVIRLKTIIWKSVKITFLFSLTIEFLQLFLRLGTFQLSDLFYNTLGGLLGGIIYFIGYKVCHKE